MQESMVQFLSISKSFPGVKALNDVSFLIKKGDIHCIIGENGAGKSTLIKILSGAIQKDSGTILFEGKEVDIRNSYDAKRLGIGTVYQEMCLVPSLNTVDNIFLGEEAAKGMMLDRVTMKHKTLEALAKLNVSIDVMVAVRYLSVAQQQMVEIARSLVFDRKLIIMDEPTSSLSQKDVVELFRIIRLLKEHGVTIIYISHKMEELEEISDSLTVMRDGCYVDTVKMGDVGINHVISLMVGRHFDANRRCVPRSIEDEAVLTVENLYDRAGKVKGVSFELPKGIIMGFAGLVGAGRTELMRLIFGADKIESGNVFVGKKKLEKITTQKAVKNGIAYLSEDRKTEGLLLKLSVRSNISLTNLDRVSSGFIINKKEEVRQTESMRDSVRIVTTDLDKLAIYLSGGNQQKVAIAKWLFTDCDILIFDEPTRGIDVGARAEIYTLMNKLVDEGKSIILVSSDMSEILTMSNIIITMHEGRLIGKLVNDEKVTQERIMKQILGGLENV